MTPSPLFRKESIRTNKRKLSKWGDADLDGSPNYFDCDPRNAFKDATPVGGERVKGEKKEPFKERLKKYIREKTPRKGKGGYSPLKEEKEASLTASKKREARKLELENLYAQGHIKKEDEQEYAKDIEDIAIKELKKEFKDKKIGKVTEYSDKVKEMLKIPGLKGTKALAKFDVEEKQKNLKIIK